MTRVLLFSRGDVEAHVGVHRNGSELPVRLSSELTSSCPLWVVHTESDTYNRVLSIAWSLVFDHHLLVETQQVCTLTASSARHCELPLTRRRWLSTIPYEHKPCKI